MGASDRFGPYVVYECLGTGGMATVHRASIELENDDTREVALKRLLPQYATDKRFVDDLIREGKLAAQLEHPNIVRVLELGRIGRTYFIAMDLVRGRSLMALMRKAHEKRRRPSIGVIIALMSEVLDALDHAHSVHIVHRDLTPSNLIVTDEGQLKIIDFGVAKALAGTLQTSSGLAKGKLGYMSLEAVMGRQVDTRADIFSAGVVMWELVAMRRLFRGNSDIELINAIREHEIDPPSHYNNKCPPELDALVLKALAQRPDDRWTSAGEMADALADLRLYHPSSRHDVIAWLHQLRADTQPAPQPRMDSDADATMVQADAEDLEVEIFEEPSEAYPSEAYPDSDHGQLLAEGSEVGTYEDVELDAPVASGGRSRFRDADTVVSVSAFLDRKKSTTPKR